MIPEDSHLLLRLASDETDLLAAQRLRYDVFVSELGGNGALVDHEKRLERDRLDPFFDHLILVDHRRERSALDHVVGVYRLMRNDQALRAGQFYSDGEYDLGVLRASGRRLLELGRSCVHRDYRGGTAMMRLWAGLANYIVEHRIEVLFGVASFHGTNTAALAEPLSLLHYRHLAPAELRVRAKPENYQRMDLVPELEIDRTEAMRSTPSLIKAYLRLGGYVGDGAWIDREFNTTDVCLVMDTAQISKKHRALYGRARA